MESKKTSTQPVPPKAPLRSVGGRGMPLDEAKKIAEQLRAQGHVVTCI